MGNEESVQAIQNDPNGTDFALNPNSFSRISTQKNSYQSTEKPFHLSNSNNLNSDTHHLNNKNYSSNNNNNNHNLLYGLNKNSNELDFHRQRSTQPTTTMLSSMTTNLIQKSAQQSGSMLNSTLGQLSSSFPNTMKPMNQLINQIQTSSFGSLGGGGGQQQQQKTSTSFGPAISNNAQQLRAQQMETSGGQQSTKIVPQATPPQVPEVDLSGLTEEEKQMIQSVMARAEQDTKNSIATSPASNPQQQQQQRAQKTSISSTVTTIPPSNHLKQTRPTSTIPSRMGVLSDDSIASSHHPQSSVVIRDQTNLMSSLGPQQPPSASSSSSLPNHPQQFEEMKSSAIHNDFQHPNSMQSNQQQFQMNRNQSNQSMQKSSQASINFQSHQPQQMLNAHNSLPCGVCNRQTNQMNLHNCNDCLKTFCDSCGDNAMSRLGPNNIKQCNLCIECSKRRQILSPNLVPPPPHSNILNSTTMKSHPSTGPQTMPSSSQSMPSRNSMMSFNNSNSIESNQFGPIIEDGYNQSSQSTNLFQSMDPTTSYLDQQSKQSSMIEANRVQQQLMGPQYSSSSIIVPVSNLNSNQYGPISSNSTETVYLNQCGNGQIQPQSSAIPNQNQIFPSNPMLQQQRQPIGMMGLVQQQPPQQSHQQDSVQSFGSIEQQQSQSQSQPQPQPQRQQQQQFDPFRTSQSMMMNQNQYQSNLKQNLQSHQQSTNLNQIKSQQQFNNTNTVNESNNVNSILNNQSSMISTLPSSSSSSTAAASASTMMINDGGVYGGNMIESGDPLHFPPQQRLHQHQHQQQQQESIQSSMMKPQNVLGSNQLFYRPSYTMPSSLTPMKTTVVPRDGSNYSSSTSSMSIAPYNTNVETSMKKFNPQQHSTGPMSSQTSSIIMDGQQNFQPIIDQSSSNHTLHNMNQAIIDQRQQTINQTNSMNQNLGESNVINNQFVPIGQDDRRQSLSQAKASSSSVTMFSVSNRSPQANTIQSMEHHRLPQQQQQHHHHHHHLSVHQPSIRHQPDATWAHSMELSPIIDVSPSLEAAEANDSLDRRRNTLQNNADNLKTITGMIDDFNRTIKNLGLSDMKNTTLMNSLDQSTLSSDKKIGWDQSVSERDESRKILTRRASTGPTEGLDQYHSVKDQYHYKSWKPSSASSAITLSSSVASSIRPSTTLGSNRSNLLKKPSSSLTSISATTTTTTAISIASNLNQEISNRMQSKSDTITLANSNQIEQHLQKQQQILIQQQQKLLQIQLEQQRLQNQIHEQQQKQHQQQQSSKSINDSTKETQRAMSGEQRRYPIESATNRLRKDGKTTVSTTSCGSTTSSLTQNHSKPLISVRALGPLDQSPSSSSSVYNQSNRQSRYRDTSTLITQHRKLPKPTGEDILSGDSRSKSIIQKSFLHQQKQQEKLDGKSYPETKRSTMNITNVSNIPQLVSSRTRSDGTVQEPRTSSTGTTTAMISPKKNTQFSTRQFLSQPQTNIVTKEKVRTLNYLDLDTKSMVSKNDNIRDGQSLKSANTRRRLPAAPAEEESISSLINTKRLIREKLGAPIKLTSNFRDDNRILFSSSYDSTIGLNTSGTKFSQMAAIANRSRANTTNESMKIIKSKSDIVPGAYSVRNYLNDFSKTSDSSTSSFTDEIKTLQRKILNEFKTDDIFKRMKEGKNQSFSGDDHSNIKKIPFETMVSNVNPTTTTTTTTSSFSTAAIKNQFGSDSACLNLDDSLTRDHLKTMMMFKTNDGTNINTGTMPKSSEIGNRSSSTMIDRDRFNRFKSFEFENLNPTRLNEEKFCLTRPISSILFNQFGNSRLTSSPYNRTLVDQKNINSSNFNGESSFRYDDLLGTIQSKSFYPESFKNDEKLRSLYRKYDLAIPNALRASNTNQSLDDRRLKSNYLFDKSLRRTNQSTNIRASPSLMFGLNSRRKNFWQSTNQSRSWHPSPFGSEVSDNERNDRNNNEIDDDDDDDDDDNNENEDDIDISIDAARLHEAVLDDLIDRELSVEENMAKIRAEIRDRRQRLANSSDQFNRTFNEYLGDDVYNEYLDRNHPSFQIDPFGRRRRNSLNDYSYLDSEMKYFNSNPYLNENGNLQRSFNLYGSYDDEFVHPLRRQQFLQQQYRRLENQQQLDRRLNPSSALNYNSVPQLGPELAYPYDHSSIGLLNDYRSKMDHRMFTGDYGLQNSADALHHVQATENQNFLRFSPKKTQFAPNSTRNPKYPFPIKRILLTQDPKIRSIDGTGIGLKVIGGKEIPGTNMIGAYIAKIHPSLSMNGEIQEGMQVIEWNGIPLTGISHDEVSKIISNQFGDEIEVVIRIDINLLSGQCGGHHYGETRTNMMMMPQQQQSTQFIRAPHHHQQQPLADTYAGSFDSYCVEQQRLGCGDPSANCCSNLIHNDSNYPTSSQPILGQPYQHQQQQHYHHPEQQQLQHQSLSSQQPQQQQQQQIILHHNHPIVNETTTDSYANTRMVMPTQMKVQSTPYNNNSNNASINNNNGNNPHQNSFSMHHLHQAQPQQEQMMMMMMNAPQSNLPNHRSMMNNAINNGVNNHHLHNHNHYHLQQQSQRPQSPTSMMQQPNNIGAYY